MEGLTPITPQQAKDSLFKKLPDGLLERLNELITDKFNGESSEIRFDALFETSVRDHDKEIMIIMAIYREAGWKVSLNPQGTFIFKI